VRAGGLIPAVPPPTVDTPSMGPFTYARLEPGGTRRGTLFATLSDALYTAMVDVAQQRGTPLGIRQGARIYYRHSQLVALAEQHQALLSAQDQWPLIQALEAEAVARLAAG
jgi:hypothetical protein